MKINLQRVPCSIFDVHSIRNSITLKHIEKSVWMMVNSVYRFGFMSNKKKKEKKKYSTPKQLHHHGFHTIDEYLLNELSPLSLFPLLPRFFSEITTTSREDRPVLFSLNYSPGGIGIFLPPRRFCPRRMEKTELKGWIKVWAIRRFHWFLLALRK